MGRRFRQAGEYVSDPSMIKCKRWIPVMGSLGHIKEEVPVNLFFEQLVT